MKISVKERLLRSLGIIPDNEGNNEVNIFVECKNKKTEREMANVVAHILHERAAFSDILYQYGPGRIFLKADDGTEVEIGMPTTASLKDEVIKSEKNPDVEEETLSNWEKRTKRSNGDDGLSI